MTQSNNTYSIQMSLLGIKEDNPGIETFSNWFLDVYQGTTEIFSLPKSGYHDIPDKDIRMFLKNLIRLKKQFPEIAITGGKFKDTNSQILAAHSLDKLPTPELGWETDNNGNQYAHVVFEKWEITGIPSSEMDALLRMLPIECKFLDPAELPSNDQKNIAEIMKGITNPESSLLEPQENPPVEPDILGNIAGKIVEYIEKEHANDPVKKDELLNYFDQYLNNLFKTSHQEWAEGVVLSSKEENIKSLKEIMTFPIKKQEDLISNAEMVLELLQLVPGLVPTPYIENLQTALTLPTTQAHTKLNEVFAEISQYFEQTETPGGYGDDSALPGNITPPMGI